MTQDFNKNAADIALAHVSEERRSFLRSLLLGAGVVGALTLIEATGSKVLAQVGDGKGPPATPPGTGTPGTGTPGTEVGSGAPNGKGVGKGGGKSACVPIGPPGPSCN